MMMVRQLDAYQEQGVREIFAAFKTHRRVCYVLPTGGGKTAVAVRVIQQYVRSGKRVLVLVHTKELIEQMVAALIRDGIDPKDIGRIRANDKTNLDAPVQVASVQTLMRRAKPVAGLVVVDECQHAVADGWASVLAWYPDVPILGLTATPIRLDGRGLGMAFDHLVHGPVFSELAAGGYLMVPRVFAPSDEGPDLRGVKTRGGDFATEDLWKRVKDAPLLMGDPVDHYRKHGGGGPAVYYAINRAHARMIEAQFRAAGVAVEYLDGDTPHREREAMVGRGGRLERGVTKVVVNCQVITEGWDLPNLKVVGILRPTKSLALYLQMCGRPLRNERRGIVVDKIEDRPVILDHAGNCYRFALPQYDRVYSLDGPRLRGGKGEALVKRCPACDHVNPISARACEECGAAFPEPQDRKVVEDGELVEISRRQEEEMWAEAARISRVGQERGLPREVLLHAWQLKYGAAAFPEES